jgi:triphosphoribosyl-dephospho-CoA synthetase
LPTYGESLGLRGKICEHWTLNPHPTLIPAIESGWVKSVHSFGSEVGMERYIAARPDIFFTGRDGSLRSNRVLCQLAGQYAVDAFVGSTLQMDADANSSTVTIGRLAGFGGAPNMGHDPHGRRHSSKAWLDLITENKPIVRGRKLVVQTVETFQKGGVPAFVETLDAVQVGKQAGMPIAPIMIYGDDVSHVVTEEGIAYLYKAEGQEERRRALAAVAGVSPVGLKAVASETAACLERRGGRLPGGPRRKAPGRAALAARRAEYAGSGGLVRWSLQPAGALSELVVMMPLLSNAVRAAPGSLAGDAPAARRLARLARQALIAEAELTPKPGLVDRRGDGAHTDLSLEVMRRSALAIEPYFVQMALASRGAQPGQTIRERLALIGRQAERAMLDATGGSNSHKGAIWALGLLVSASAMHDDDNGNVKASTVAGTTAKAIASFEDRAIPRLVSHGDMVAKRYGVVGARGEALSGFPHVVDVGLPALRRKRRSGASEQVARLDALLSIMASLDDTCLLYRGGLVALRLQKMAPPPLLPRAAPERLGP